MTGIEGHYTTIRTLDRVDIQDMSDADISSYVNAVEAVVWWQAVLALVCPLCEERKGIN